MNEDPKNVCRDCGHSLTNEIKWHPLGPIHTAWCENCVNKLLRKRAEFHEAPKE